MGADQYTVVQYTSTYSTLKNIKDWEAQCYYPPQTQATTSRLVRSVSTVPGAL